MMPSCYGGSLTKKVEQNIIRKNFVVPGQADKDAFVCCGMFLDIADCRYLLPGNVKASDPFQACWREATPIL
jgi:hypothetical protein